MKDFHVAPVEMAEGVEGEAEANPHPAEAPLDRFRRISKQVASQSANIKWNEVIRNVTIEAHSQIGRCKNRESFKNQQNLLRAMEQAKKLIERGPSIPASPNPSDRYNMDQTNHTLIQLLKNISEEINDISPSNTLRVAAPGARSASPLASLNAQLQCMLSAKTSPYPTQQKSKTRGASPNPRSLSMEGCFSPPPNPLPFSEPDTPTSPKSRSESPKPSTAMPPSILKNRSPTPDSQKSIDFIDQPIPVIEIIPSEPPALTFNKPEAPVKLINLETDSKQEPLKPSPGSPVKVIKRKAPAPQDISVSRPTAAKPQATGQGMIPPPPSKEIARIMQIPVLSTTPPTPLPAQRPLEKKELNADAISDTSSIAEVKEVEEETPPPLPITSPPAPLKRSSVPAMIATSSSMSACSTEKLIPDAETKPAPPSPMTLRPVNKVEDVKTIKRQPKTGWL